MFLSLFQITIRVVHFKFETMKNQGTGPFSELSYFELWL